MKDFFIALSDKLKEVTTLKWIDEDMGQMDFYEIRPSVAFPCALIDIELPDCKDLNTTEQNVTARITLRLCFEPTGQSNTAAPVATRERSLTRWETVDALFNLLQGWSGTTFTELSRKSQVTEKREDKYKVIQQVWETTFVEAVENV